MCCSAPRGSNLAYWFQAVTALHPHADADFWCNFRDVPKLFGRVELDSRFSRIWVGRLGRSACGIQTFAGSVDCRLHPFGLCLLRREVVLHLSHTVPKKGFGV